MNAAAHALGPNPMQACAETLRDALEAESRLLNDLLAVLLRQRRGVATEDLQTVDDSVYAAHRVLRTLEEARRRRRTLLGVLAGTEDVPLERLEDALGNHADDPLLRARDALLDLARGLSREIAVNRRVLRHALSTGEAQMRTLCGVAPSGPIAYDGSAAVDQRGGGLLVNRRV